ncbi:hypothetical protein [Cupriavidus basilensis]|uniref:Uncharacterized protein n=1 Tax=Cupriavidus basilensis TaxID=68895 RepID=A0A0C4YGX3_9BURK|nr:hypothetical protein [Cupriavidus basilensis]AJG22188.1 hypothetical protein RR42_s0595 [Cupriavidus basilensis]
MICITGTGGIGGTGEGTDAALPGLPPSAAAGAEVAEAVAGDWADEGGAEAARKGGMETAVMG